MKTNEILRKIRSTVLLDIYRKNLKQENAYLNSLQWESIDEIRESQIKKLNNLLLHIKSVQFYKEYLDEYTEFSDPIITLKKLPIIKKEQIIEKSERFINPLINSHGIGYTSGSTGLSLQFYYDKNFLIQSDLLTQFYRSWFDISPGDKFVKVWGRPLKGIKNKIKCYLSDLLRGAKTVDPWELSTEKNVDKIKEIFKFRPIFIYGYATSLVEITNDILLLGMEQEARRLNLKAIISTAETLLLSDQKKITQIFNCPVVNEYGAAEVSIIAHECPYNNLHISTDFLFLEFVDDNGNDVIAGRSGYILVTSFINKYQPLVRYKIGDIGTPLGNKICECGRNFPLMKLDGAKIIEMIKTPNGHKFSAEILDYINLTLIKDNSIGIKRFRVTQKTLNLFVIEIVPDITFGEHSKTAFCSLFKKYLKDTDLEIDFIIRNKIERPKSGKLLYFISEINEHP